MNHNQKTGFESNRFLASVNPDFKCGICLGIVNDPVHCSNQGADLFCRHCLEEWYKKRAVCPTCRAKARLVKKKPVTESVSLIIRKQILALDIKCNFEERGCTIVTKIETISAHEKECDYNYSDVVAAKIEKMQSDMFIKNSAIKKLEFHLGQLKNDSENLYKQLETEKCRFDTKTAEMTAQFSKTGDKLVEMASQIADRDETIAQLEYQNQQFANLLETAKSDFKKTTDQVTARLNKKEETIRELRNELAKKKKAEVCAEKRRRSLDEINEAPAKRSKPDSSRVVMESINNTPLPLNHEEPTTNSAKKDETIAKLKHKSELISEKLKTTKFNYEEKISNIKIIYTSNLAKKEDTIRKLRNDLAAMEKIEDFTPNNRRRIDNGRKLAPANRDLLSDVEEMMRNKNTTWINCDYANMLSLRMKYALLKMQVTFAVKDWIQEHIVIQFFKTVCDLKPGNNVFVLGDMGMKFLTAIALYVGKRGSVYVNYDCCSADDKEVYENIIRTVRPTLKKLQDEANIVFLKNKTRQDDNLAGLDKECEHFVAVKKYERLALRLDTISVERRDHDEMFTFRDAIEFLRD